MDTLRWLRSSTAMRVMLLVIAVAAAHAQQNRDALPRIGPSKGALILHGGGTNTARDFEHYRRFAALAGGPSASVVVILTPLDVATITPRFLEQYRKMWHADLGLPLTTFMDTRERREADTDAFVEPLRRASGVWILGGHLTNLLDVYLGTRVEHEIVALIERGGVVGGSSAGAMIQGSVLLNLSKEPSDLRFSRNKMYLDRGHMTGFGLLRNVAVYPHLSARDSQRDLVELAARFPHITGLGIDENTAAIVSNDWCEVIGQGKVTIVTRSAKPITLSKGERFALRLLTRKE